MDGPTARFSGSPELSHCPVTGVLSPTSHPGARGLSTAPSSWRAGGWVGGWAHSAAYRVPAGPGCCCQHRTDPIQMCESHGAECSAGGDTLRLGGGLSKGQLVRQWFPGGVGSREQVGRTDLKFPVPLEVRVPWSCPAHPSPGQPLPQAGCPSCGLRRLLLPPPQEPQADSWF